MPTVLVSARGGWAPGGRNSSERASIQPIWPFDSSSLTSPLAFAGPGLDHHGGLTSDRRDPGRGARERDLSGRLHESRAGVAVGAELDRRRADLVVRLDEVGAFD
jgi:hypothetical protein